MTIKPVAMVVHMGDEDDSTPPGDRITSRPEPPYQALLPNLDRMSRSSFTSGTISRRRINRALLVLALAPMAALAVIFLVQFITG